MYKLLLVLASAAALKRPQRALAVRGGEIGVGRQERGARGELGGGRACA